jgi:cytochrome c-type biogenesis protein CcsB
VKKIISILASSWLMVTVLLVFATTIAIGTFIESRQSTEIAWKLIYNTKWFELLLLFGVINLSLSIITRKLYKKEKLSIFLFHTSFIVILLGAGITRYFGIEGSMQIMEGSESNKVYINNTESLELPFSIFLNDFIVDYYPGSKNPSGYESLVVLVDKEKGIHEVHRIFMNHILKHRGYRFYQSSYPQNQKGTILSVRRDGFGTSITYLGYILLIIGIVFSLMNKNSRFVQIIRSKSTAIIIILLFSLFSSSLRANDSIPIIPLEHASKFGEILVRDESGRTKPLNTLVEDIFRKVYRKSDYHGQTAMQTLLGFYVYPEFWQNAKIIYAGKNVQQLIDIKGQYVSLQDCYVGQGFFLSTMEAVKAYRVPPSQRSKPQNDLIRFDERLNILYQWFGGTMLNIFPSASDTSTVWYSPINVQGTVNTGDSLFLYKILHVYFAEVRNANENGNWQTANELVDAIKKYQTLNGDNLPTTNKITLERWYYEAQIFKRISNYYFLFGLALLIVLLVKVFNERIRANKLQNVLVILIGLTLLIHTFGLAIRWYISGHAPWSNAYETMVFIAWSGVLAGVIFARKNKTAPALAAVMASIYLFAGHMSWMDPQLTNLVPVLKSKWLVIHVAVITSSYGFLGIGTLMAFVNLILMSLQNAKNFKQTQNSISNLSRIVELVLTAGVYLLTIGTFLGAVWANVSWGRYWAWDPKETWALITILVYAIVLHLRLIPSLRGEWLFNFLAVLSYASVLMTYFGVNYYLSGLHSYATGDPAPVPKSVYYTLAVILLVSLAAFMSRTVLKNKKLIT